MSEPAPEVGSKAPWWMEAIKTLGLPTAFLCVIVYMIWSAGTWAGTAIVFPLFQKQMDFIDQASEMTKSMEVTMSKIDGTLSAHGEHALESLKICSEIRNVCAETAGETKLNSERIRVGNQELIGVLKKIEENTSPTRSLASEDTERP